MAFSQSIRRAQIPKPCELCETDTNIKWKCVQCNTLMCDKCKKIHLKVLTHDIVDVKSSEAKKEMEHTIITDNIPCQIHKRKMNCMFCRTCDQLVCPECITDSHKKHDLDSIDKVYIEKKRELKQLESQYTNKLTLCKIEDSKVNDCKTKSEQLFAESVQKINQQEMLITDEVRKYAAALREQMESEKQRMEKSITEKEKHMKEVKETLLSKQKSIHEILESNQAVNVFSADPEFSKKETPNACFKTFHEETKDFIPTKENVKAISNLFGSLQNTKLPKVLPQVNLDVIKSYTTDLSSVYKVLIQDEKTAWISDHTTSSLHCINIDDTIKTVNDITARVYDMSLTDNNDVLLSLAGSTDICLLTTKTGEIKHFLSVSPLYPFGIHITKHNEIILVVNKGGRDQYNPTNKSCWKLLIFGMDGKQKQSYDNDKQTQTQLTIPDRITSNDSNDILVIDRTSDNDGRVVVLDRAGQIKKIYRGHPQINSGDKLFNPLDIVTNLKGHVIVSDVYNDALHVLSEEGDLLTCKIMTDQGILYPVSLVLDTQGQLWVGCASKYIHTTDAKLHVVKMSF